MFKRASAVLSLAAIATIAGYVGGKLSNSNTTPPGSAAAPAVLRAKRFEVVDDGGRVVAVLTNRELTLLDSGGKARATLRLEYKDNGSLAFSDGRWNARAVFGFLGGSDPEDDDWGRQILRPDAHTPLRRAYFRSGTVPANGFRGRQGPAVPRETILPVPSSCWPSRIACRRSSLRLARSAAKRYLQR
jgi:hypothetical protein